MKRSTEKRVAIAFWLVLTVLAIVRLVYFSVTTRYLDNSQRVEHSRRVLQELHATLSALQDAETGERGFIISNDEGYLEPYRLAVDAVPQRLSVLRSLVADDPDQLARFARAEDLASRKMAIINEFLTLYRTGGFNAAQPRIREGTGKRIMDDFRSVILQMDAAENDRLNSFTIATASGRQRSMVSYGLLTLLDFVLLSIAFLTIHRYAAARDRAEAELRSTSALQQLILDSAGNAIITGDTSGRVKIFNRTAERWLGYRASEVVGKTDWPWIDPEEIQQRLEELSRERGEPVTNPVDAFVARTQGDRADVREWSFIKRSGERLPVRMSVTALHDADGNVTGYVGIAADISEQRDVQRAIENARDAAEQANRAKSMFLANMSHELRTPLNAIIGYSEMLAEDAHAAGQTQSVDDLQKITQAGKHLLALINDILDLSKVEAGKMRLHLEPFSVAIMIRDVVSTVMPMVRQNNNTLTVDAPESIGSMTADLTKVRQVLFNLLSNAMKFTTNGEVSVSAKRVDHGGVDEIHFAVRDNGIGMNATQMDSLFQAFSQAETSTASRFGGTGLGLAISRQFCRMMGGDIDVRSDVGHGSTFTVRLPADVVDRSGESTSTVASRAITAPATGGTVLVVDDDPAVQDLLTRFLESDGFNVVTTASGIDALRLARDVHPIAITLDVMIPEMDGWAILGELKSDPSLRDIPVIMLSIVDDKSMGYALGAAAFMTKPIDRVELLRVLNRYRDSHPKSILVVEDDKAAAELIGRALADDGWDVRFAENGRVGLELLEQRIPTLILLDLMMPLMDGFEFTAELRRHERFRDIPIVVVTSKELTDDDRRRLNGNVQRIMTKSGMSRQQILSEVRTTLHRKLEAENQPQMGHR